MKRYLSFLAVSLLVTGAGLTAGCSDDEDDGGGTGGATGGTGGATGGTGGATGGTGGGTGGATGGTGGGTGGTGGGAAGTGGSADSGTVPSCADYCDVIMANCTGDNLQYVEESYCLAVCATFPEGEPDDSTGNSRACRATHAALAPDNATLHCPHAGPAGAVTCGSNCEGYCNIAVAVCDEFDSQTTCVSACDALDLSDETDLDYSSSAAAGNNLFCRISHAANASVAPDPTDHCGHAETSPSAICL